MSKLVVGFGFVMFFCYRKIKREKTFWFKYVKIGISNFFRQIAYLLC